MYRVSYGEDASLSYDEARANLDNKFNAIFPGPKPVKYDLRMFSPYKLHQRRSNKFRVGRVLLSGDAAHACNPFGGMGLTGGLCDAGGLSDCLIGVLRKGCGDDLLDKYAAIRQNIFNEVDTPGIKRLTVGHRSYFAGEYREIVQIGSRDCGDGTRTFQKNE
jgi:2-polyprenyl-6-methoxyphenol hydroxylase-like FAD-dependent oxidoreductase